MLHKLKRPSIIFFITFHNTLYPVLTRFFRWMVRAWDFQARCRLALQEAETGWAEKRFASERQPRNTVELSFHFLNQYQWTHLNISKLFKPSKSMQEVLFDLVLGFDNTCETRQWLLSQRLIRSGEVTPLPKRLSRLCCIWMPCTCAMERFSRTISLAFRWNAAYEFGLCSHTAFGNLILKVSLEHLRNST